MSAFTKPAGVVSEIDADQKMLRFGVPKHIMGLSNPNETGMDRLRQMYSFTNGKPSPELMILKTVGVLSTLTGFLVGGLNYGKQARESFKRQNYASKFQNQRDFIRRFYDHQFLHSCRGGTMLAWRVGLFSILYTGTAISGSVYRNKFGILEHSVAGTLAAAIYRCHLGLRIMTLGSTIGLVYGTTAGCMCVLLTKLFGITFEDLRREGYKATAEMWEKEEMKKHEKLAIKLFKEQQEEAERI